MLYQKSVSVFLFQILRFTPQTYKINPYTAKFPRQKYSCTTIRKLRESQPFQMIPYQKKSVVQVITEEKKCRKPLAEY